MKLLRFNSYLLAFAALGLPLSAQTNTFPSSGGVGIGTVSPSVGKLEIVKSSSYNSENSAGIAINTGASGQPEILFGADNGNSIAYIQSLSKGTSIGPLAINATGGNVGIGTTSPVNTLSVVGTGYFTSKVGIGTSPTALGQMLQVQGTANQFAEKIFGSGMTGQDFGLRIAAGSNSSDYSLRILKNDDATDYFSVRGDGNVGIGTTNPRSRLDIGTNLGANNGARFGDYLEINEREVVNNAVSIGWNAAIAANDGTYVPAYAPGTGMVLAMAGGGVADLDFWGRNWGGNGAPVNLGAFTHVMRLSTNGNVGIGTTNPTQKLSVNGTIQAKEVVVQTGWSDYVFDDDYKLKALSEVEAYVKAEHHLPGIPSAKEVAEHGVGMGEMQSKFLAKIEELTLHQIAQEKRLNDAYGRLQKLEAENAALRAGHHN